MFWHECFWWAIRNFGGYVNDRFFPWQALATMDEVVFEAARAINVN